MPNEVNQLAMTYLKSGYLTMCTDDTIDNILQTILLVPGIDKSLALVNSIIQIGEFIISKYTYIIIN